MAALSASQSPTLILPDFCDLTLASAARAETTGVPYTDSVTAGGGEEFFVGLGGRIAALRKQAQITQVQLAQTLGVAQSTLNAYELGQRRVPVSALPTLARALAVSLEELIGAPLPAARKRRPAPKLQQHIERISQLPKAKQRFVMQVLESVLAQASR